MLFAGSSIGIALLLLLGAPAADNDTGLTDHSQLRSVALSILGDRLFREARFEDAAAAYSEAVALDSENIQGQLGMGKIASLHSETRRATGYYSTAYRAAPRNPDAILALAGVVEDPEARRILLRNFLTYSRDARVEDVRARLRIAEQIGTAPLSVLNSPYEPYRIPLLTVRTGGISLRARINGGRELRLLLDTGAAGIVLNASAAVELDLDFLADAALCGFGSAAPTPARIARASSFETGSLKIGNLLVHVSENNLMREADGVIGPDVFEKFRIVVDTSARTLELTPLADSGRTDPEEAVQCLPTLRLGTLWLVRGTVDGHGEGYFVLDSGSPFSMISRKLSPREGPVTTLEGAQGGQAAAHPSVPVNIRLGDQHYMDFDYATFDASEISARNGFEISGTIGYSVLRHLRVTIDYRAGMVKLEKPRVQ